MSSVADPASDHQQVFEFQYLDFVYVTRHTDGTQSETGTYAFDTTKPSALGLGGYVLAATSSQHGYMSPLVTQHVFRHPYPDANPMSKSIVRTTSWSTKVHCADDAHCAGIDPLCGSFPSSGLYGE